MSISGLSHVFSVKRPKYTDIRTITPLGTFATPDARFNRVHIDIVGTLPVSNGNSYLLTCIDRFTKWPEVLPIPDTYDCTNSGRRVCEWMDFTL